MTLPFPRQRTEIFKTIFLKKSIVMFIFSMVRLKGAPVPSKTYIYAHFFVGQGGIRLKPALA